MRIVFQLTAPFFFALLSAMSFSSVAAARGLTMAEKPQLQTFNANEASLEMTSPGKTEAETPRDPRVIEAARMYEKYFLNQMVKAMRSTVKHSDIQKPSMGEEIYRDQLDDQYVDSWTANGGIGLANMIHDELMGKAEMAKRRRAALKESKGKTRTPMALTERDILNVRRLPNANGGAETVLVSLGKSTIRPGEQPESVRSSWDGKVVAMNSENGKVILAIESPMPLSSGPQSALSKEESNGKSVPMRKIELAYDGVPFEVSVGAQIRAGQVIGHLSRGARGILVRQMAGLKEASL